MDIVQYTSMGFYCILSIRSLPDIPYYEGWNFNSVNYLFTTDTK